MSKRGSSWMSSKDQQVSRPAWATSATDVRPHPVLSKRRPSATPPPQATHSELAQLRPGESGTTPAATPSSPPLGDPHSKLVLALESEKEQFVAAISELVTARTGVIQQAEADLVTLAVDIAELILERELENRPEVHVSIARTAIRVLGNPAGARLRASKKAYSAIVDTVGTASIESDGIAVPVILDASLPGLGCVAEDDRSCVDARIGERLEIIRNALREEAISPTEGRRS